MSLRGRAIGPAPVLVFALVVGVASTVHGAMVRLAVEAPTASWEETHMWSADRWIVEAGPRRVVIDLDAGAMEVTHAAGTRDVRTLATVRSSAARADAAGRRLVRRVPPEARDAPIVAAGNPAFRFTLRRAGAAETIAGVRAVPYRLESPVLAGEVWIAPDLALPAPAAEWLALAVDVAGVRLAGSKLAGAIARLGGFPVRVALRSRGGAVWSATAVEVAATDAEVALTPRR